jgi:Tol biopolymer transport system component
MDISAGTRIGPFDVVALIGAGGMGTVYRAYDPRLRREVAIKVLPAAFAADADRLRRFEQEALAVARLAHPNILAVHDIGTHDLAPFIVTELLEGETLRERIGGSPLPVRRAVDYAIQIARGLALAHDHGIVHRDIKPENLFVTSDGRIKILDFGLAKLTDDETAVGADTVTQTQPMEVVGTASYMSPEQARGVRADHRSDLFSLGVVLYEMLTGKSPFRRETAAETMAAILRDDVPDLPSSTCPPALNRIARHALEKNPAARFQSARDLEFDLEGASDSPPQTGVASRDQRPRRWLVRLTLAVGILAAAAAVAIERRSAALERPYEITGVHRLTDFTGLEEFPAIAPDLKSLAFTARVAGFQQVFVRLMAGGTPLQVTKDAADHVIPRWSSDASSIIYFSPARPDAIQGTVWEIPALGGPPRRVIDSVGGADRARDGRLACFQLSDRQTQLVIASQDGADRRAIARFDEPVYYKYPRWSPDGKWIAYQRGDGVRWDVFAVEVATGNVRQLTHDNRQIHGLSWLPDSRRIVYSSGRGSSMPYLSTLGLWEQSLDGGEPRRVAPADVSYLYPDVHSSGLMLASRMEMEFDLWRYPVDGSPSENVQRASRITSQTGQVQTPTVGLGDREIAYLSDSGGHANLWVTRPETRESRQITYERDPRVALGVPIWSPSGKWIGFVSSRGNTGLGFGLWIVDPDGGNLRRLVPQGLGFTWSPDAEWVYYADAGVMYKVPASGGTPAVVRRPARNVAGFDGRTLYFMIDRTLTDGSPGFEIHAATPEDGESRLLARIPASRAPQWQIVNPSLSPDGSSLAVPLTDGVTTNIWTLSTKSGEWREVTDFSGTPTFIARRVSWSTDGRSIVAAVGVGDADIIVFETK